MAGRDRAAGDVDLFAVDAEPVAAIDHLHRERLVQFPETDVVDAEAVRLQQLGHGEHRADAYFVGIAAGDRDAAIDPERLEIAPLRKLHGKDTARKLKAVSQAIEGRTHDNLAAPRRNVLSFSPRLRFRAPRAHCRPSRLSA